MCQPKIIEDTIGYMPSHMVFDNAFLNDDDDSYQEDDINDIGLIDDPNNTDDNDENSDLFDSEYELSESDLNDYSDEEFMMVNDQNYSNVNIQFFDNGLIYINQIEQDHTSGKKDTNPFLFLNHTNIYLI